MTREPIDAIVIGGGVNGLTAAAYLARAGKRTALLEARDTLGGVCDSPVFGTGFRANLGAHCLYALDPIVVSDLRLGSRGLKFALRDAPLSLLSGFDGCLTLARDPRASARAIALHSKADAESWTLFRRELLKLGRAARARWWHARGQIPELALLDSMARTGSGDWVSSHFESEALRTLILFGATEVSPLEPGSALILAWRAAQEMSGLQAAVSIPCGGSAALVASLAGACKHAGVDIRTDSRVRELLVDGDRISGVRLASGEVVYSPVVLSSLSRRATLLELAKGVGVGFTEFGEFLKTTLGACGATVNLALAGWPSSTIDREALKGRIIFAERPESYVLAHAASRAGRLPEELIMQVTFPSLVDPGRAPEGKHLASILVRPLPREPEGGWAKAKPLLAARVVYRLNRHFRGLANLVVGVDVFTPDDRFARYGSEETIPDPARLLQTWPARISTPIEGLFLCGADAEPMPAVSGRAGRIAAALATPSVVRR